MTIATAQPMANLKSSVRAVTLNAGVGHAILRTAIGAVFVAHGWQKLTAYGFEGVSGMMSDIGVPLPYLSAVLVTVTELIGGVALIAGAFTRLAAIPLAFTMLVALTTVHLKQGFFLPHGFEYVLVLLAACVALTLTGGGSFSVDELLQRRRIARGMKQ